MTQHTFARAPFTFRLLLDEDSGRFRCTASPSLPQTFTDDQQLNAYKTWTKMVARGWAQRHNGRKALVQFDQRDAMRGMFVLRGELIIKCR